MAETLVLVHGMWGTASHRDNFPERYRQVATFVELPDHGHWLLGEPGWDEIAERIERWLETISRETG